MLSNTISSTDTLGFCLNGQLFWTCSRVQQVSKHLSLGIVEAIFCKMDAIPANQPTMPKHCRNVMKYSAQYFDVLVQCTSHTDRVHCSRYRYLFIKTINNPCTQQTDRHVKEVFKYPELIYNKQQCLLITYSQMTAE